MRRMALLGLLGTLLVGLGILLLPGWAAQAQTAPQPPLIVGEVLNKQKQPVTQAAVTLMAPGEGKPLAEAQTQADGSFILSAGSRFPQGAFVQVARPHFEAAHLALTSGQIDRLRAGRTVTLPATTLSHRVGLAFWIASAIFVLMLVLIAAGGLHNTLAALISAALMLGVSYLGSPLSTNLFIFNFGEALHYVDWNVIFLVMGMMIVIAVVEATGIFQWLALHAYQASGGRGWLLLVMLMLIAGVASAFLDNVTTMLLMTPITIEIAMALEMNPLALLVPEVLASNVVGISTLIGTPTNILIGSYAGLSFNDFLVHQTPGVLLAFLALVAYSYFAYRKELKAVNPISPDLLAQLEKRGQIREPEHLKKAGWVGAGMLVLFVSGQALHLQAAVTALLGATALLVWIRPDVEETIEAVDWSTLVFFISLFIVVGGIEEVGVISLVANEAGKIVGQNLLLAMFMITWFSGLFSTFVANIPFTAAMLPVVASLSGNIPAASNNVLYYCLSVGSAMGGNGSLIASSANMVAAGISKRAGYPIRYMYFLKKGMPALLITIGLAFLWLVIRFL
jgi:Na+/H+ antiporter NhaD/arsenite permease-like protein